MHGLLILVARMIIGKWKPGTGTSYNKPAVTLFLLQAVHPFAMPIDVLNGPSY